jgi:hypothetical protein
MLGERVTVAPGKFYVKRIVVRREGAERSYDWKMAF